MKRALFALLLLAAPTLRAQDAKSFALAGCGTATTLDAFAVYWNPAALAVRENHVRNAAVAAGLSGRDSTNIGMPILDYTGHKASQMETDPVRRSHLYQGLFAVQHRAYGAGFLHEDGSDLWASQSALDFTEALRTAGLPAGASYSPERHERRVRARHVILGAGRAIPVGGSIPFLAVGGSFKYMLGDRYETLDTVGTFVQGSTDALASSRFRAGRGKGISYDAGTLVKLASGFQAGVVWENLSSKVTWSGVAETLRHDVNTGTESVAASTETDWETELPRAVRVGLVLMPEGKDIQIIGESRHVDRRTKWRFALERLYPRQRVTLRAGLLKDPVTDLSTFTLGGGWYKGRFDVNAGVLTRKFPAVLESQSIGGAVSAGYIF
jgi:hypothetical protein